MSHPKPALAWSSWIGLRGPFPRSKGRSTRSARSSRLRLVGFLPPRGGRFMRSGARVRSKGPPGSTNLIPAGIREKRPISRVNGGARRSGALSWPIREHRNTAIINRYHWSASTNIQRESMNRQFRNIFAAVLSIAAIGPFLLRRRRGSGRVRDAQEGHVGRGDHRVPAGQRPPRAPVPRSDAAQGDRQPDGPGRLASRGLRRDGHGPSSGAHALQGDADPPRHPRRDEGARSPVQWLDLARSNQLLRDIARLRPEPRVRHPARGRPHDQ